MDRTAIFGSFTCVAPSLAYVVPTQKGWNIASEIVNSKLFDQAQLYAINGLRPTNPFESQGEVLARSAKYYQVVSSLLKDQNAPFLPHIEGKRAFVWTMRGKGKQNPPIALICHSSRAELCVATYNLAASMMQW